MLLRDITLTDAQKAQLKTLQEQDRAQMESRRAEFDKQRDAMKALREKGDTAAVRAQLTQRRAQMDQERDRRSAAIRNILTADQRVTFDKNVAAAKQRESERGQRGEGFGRRGEGRGQKGGKQGAADRTGR
jgi:Spy/CpxP family protein refolding chaperone